MDTTEAVTVLAIFVRDMYGDRQSAFKAHLAAFVESGMDIENWLFLSGCDIDDMKAANGWDRIEEMLPGRNDG